MYDELEKHMKKEVVARRIEAKDSPCGQIQHLQWEAQKSRETISEMKEKMETKQVNLEVFG